MYGSKALRVLQGHSEPSRRRIEPSQPASQRTRGWHLPQCVKCQGGTHAVILSGMLRPPGCGVPFFMKRGFLPTIAS